MKDFDPCPTVAEALSLLQETFDICEKQKNDCSNKLRIFETPDQSQVPLSEEEKALLIRKIEEYNHNYEKIANWLYSLPWVRPHLKAFMIDIKFGDERGFHHLLPSEIQELSSSGKEAFEEHAESIVGLLESSPKSFTAKTGGALFSEIEKYLSEYGFTATDRGYGGCGGHLGYPCTEEERDKLLLLLHSRFGKAIRAGMISTKVAWFAVRPPRKNRQEKYEFGG